MSANRDPLAGQRLDSWKAIAAFFGRAERTVKRWESERGLPVHRIPGNGRGVVFAYSDELSGWLKGRNEELEGDDAAEAAKPAALASGGISPSVFSRAGNAAWFVPLALAAGMAFIFFFGYRGLSSKAIASRPIPDPGAQDLYLKGRYYWERRTPEDLNKAVDYFTQAIVKDPSAAPAYVGLADCYNLLREFGAMPSKEAYPRALAAAQRAVELDGASAEAHSSLAFVTYWWSWKGATAEREFRRALQLDPNLVRAHHWYATYLLDRQRFPEALDQINQAQRLEPSSSAILADKGLILWAMGRHADGVALLTQLEAAQPTFSSPHGYLANMFNEQGNYRDAMAEWRKSAELRHDPVALAVADAREQGFAAAGARGMWERELVVREELFAHGSGSAVAIAETCAELGKAQKALEYLQIGFDQHDDAMLTDKPTLRVLQNQPTYERIRSQVRELQSE